MATFFDKENMVNQVGSPYVPSAKKTPKSSSTNKSKGVKSQVAPSRLALQEVSAKRAETDDRQQLMQQIDALKQALAKQTQALQEAENVIRLMKVAEAAAEHEVASLRRKLAAAEESSSVLSDDEPEMSTTPSYKDLPLGFRVPPLVEAEGFGMIVVGAEMAPVIATPAPQKNIYADLCLGFSVHDLPVDF